MTDAKTVMDKRQDRLDEILTALGTAYDDAQDLSQELRDVAANMAEHFSQTERYERLEELCDDLEGAVSLIEDARDEFEKVELV